VGEDRRLRWDLEAVYDALDQHRHERGLTWKDAAQEMGCTTHQLTGLKTARYAIGMKLMMRIVQWIGRPAATFIYSAGW
jgi:plasmid maintenance system antidote protein VapI